MNKQLIYSQVIGQRKQIDQIYRALNRKCCLLPNVNLIIGQTGSGKTYITDLIAKDVGKNIIYIDATLLTAKGWADGNYIDTEIINRLQEGSAYTETLIIVDEFDKIGKPAMAKGGTNHAHLIQQNFLKLLDGTDLKVTNGRTYRYVNTKDFQWLLLGAFSDMDSVIPRQIGFNKESKEEDNSVLKQRLIMYGFIQELVGRILTIIRLDDVTEKMFHEYLEDDTTEFNLALHSLRLDYKDLPEINYAALLTEASSINLGMRGLLQACQSELDRLYEWAEANPISQPKLFTGYNPDE